MNYEVSKIRQSNMELLRTIAMFLVLLVHADYFTLGAPTASDCIEDTLGTSLKVIFEAVSIACVNIFICLSGWFGIRPSVKGFSNFIFQCLFWAAGLYLSALLTGSSTLSLAGIMDCLMLTHEYWFVKAYLLLYLLSPVLNTFIEQAPRSVFCKTLAGFFAFEFIYGWLFRDSTAHLQDGYSTISFIGLYMLAAYIRRYQPMISRLPSRCYAAFLLLGPIAVTLLCLTPALSGINTAAWGNMWLHYTSPYCILYAMSLLLLFSRFRIQSKFINWVAASSFAVYLLHANPHIFSRYVEFFADLYRQTDSLAYWFYTLGYLILVYIAAILADQFRIVLWKLLWKKATDH